MVPYADANCIRCELPICSIADKSMHIGLWPTPVDYSLRTSKLSTTC